MIIAVMFPWLTMQAKPTEAPLRTAKTADSLGLNWNPIISPRLFLSVQASRALV